MVSRTPFLQVQIAIPEGYRRAIPLAIRSERKPACG
jgi:hypothetical protein